ncbi:MAG: hypothetical protein ACRD03_02930 [Acidimicrobiales bacterium]
MMATFALAGSMLFLGYAWTAYSDDSGGGTVIEEAATSCEVDDEPSFAILDDGRTLTMDGENAGTMSDASYEDFVEDFACVLAALDMPASVGARMSNTRALDGMQDATWGDISASWTYHPDDGLNLILEVAERDDAPLPAETRAVRGPV